VTGVQTCALPICIFEDFDKNKEIIYTFINALGKEK